MSVNLVTSPQRKRKRDVRMDGTRPQILHFVLRHSSATVEDIATALHLAPATVRRHLDILQRDNLVAYREVRRKTGRPEHVFYLTENGLDRLPKSYDNLLSMLLDEIKALNVQDIEGRDGRSVLQTALQRIGERLVERHENRMTDKSFQEQLVGVVDILRGEDFYPELDWAGPGRVRIRLLNCPFRCVAQGNNAVCCIDKALITNLLNTEVDRENCLADGSPSCSYVIAVKPSIAPRPADSTPAMV